jgi:hypothetical protein
MPVRCYLPAVRLQESTTVTVMSLAEAGKRPSPTELALHQMSCFHFESNLGLTDASGYF